MANQRLAAMDKLNRLKDETFEILFCHIDDDDGTMCHLDVCVNEICAIWEDFVLDLLDGQGVL
jgi:hypothetical protein